MGSRIAVTGGAGFVGAHLCRRLVAEGHSVIVLDSLHRGSMKRLAGLEGDLQLVELDIRDEQALTRSLGGVDVVFHLAAINGTENFYKRPQLVLDVGILGAIAVVNACQAANVPDLVVASSAEVYQTPPVIPTPEDVPLCLPNSTNPRFSYGGSKIATELIAFNYHRDHFRKLQVFRPHNVYGPDMGTKHVIPQFIMRAIRLAEGGSKTNLPFPIQGNGTETRAFCYIDDVVEGILTMYREGAHREVYHIGSDDETAILTLVDLIGAALGLQLAPESGPIQEGSAPRRCPALTKIRSLGYRPTTTLQDGVRMTVEWYVAHAAELDVTGIA
jgi:UDP-glucose 4-epimerase